MSPILQEQRISFSVSGDIPHEEEVGLTDITQDVIPEDDRDGDFLPSIPRNRRGSIGDPNEEKDKFPFMSKREARFSTTSRFSLASHISFSGLTSRASMASLRSTLTKVNSELYPERGSFIATSLGQSFAELPSSIATKLYIVTQVLAAVSVSIGSMAVGFSAAYTSPALASMSEPNSTLNITDEQKSWVGSLMPLSALTGRETIQPEIRGTLGLLPTTIGNTGQDDNAERSLQWLRGTDNVVEFELEAIQQNYEMSKSETSSLKDIFKRQYIKPLSLSIGLMLVQQLSGINAVIFYTVDIFKLSGSSIDENLSTIIVGVVNFLSCFLANILIDKLGRKILLYISDVAMIVSLFALGSYFYVKDLSDPEDITNEWNSTIESIAWLPLVSFMIYVIAFSLGWGPIPWLFMGEALPAKIRGPAASLVTAFNWGCTFIVTKTFPGMIEKMGAFGVFYMFGVVMVIGLVFCIMFVPETKGKTLEEIEAQLSGRPTEYGLRRRYSEISVYYTILYYTILYYSILYYTKYTILVFSDIYATVKLSSFTCSVPMENLTAPPPDRAPTPALAPAPAPTSTRAPNLVMKSEYTLTMKTPSNGYF
ncbi:Facilitated trehalose transporter Tret1 [Armadillidium nasatum]|uniref:Facilitated trehalose transporter Tret1 n=1 Tax=Armadillidium nasatum TaxID=96803 RepID=A0A5N5TCK4_9CRUS|nr:Facilitated trehalose transporter Tret1 [Armadillidium nasatum]